MTSISTHPFINRISRCVGLLWTLLRFAVMAFAAVAGLATLAMVLLICVDILVRLFGYPFAGTYDIVRFLGTIAIAGALPYTTAVKGHVAVEYFFHKLHRVGRILVDTVSRLIVMVLFSTFSWQCVRHGLSLKAANEVSLTLGLPLFWMSYVIAAACFLTTLVVLYNLLHPGREMIKP